MSYCLFCNITREKLFENDLAYVIYDKFPVNPGHLLVIPKRHISDVFESSNEEMVAIFELILECKKLLDEKYKPDGYNIGTNAGNAAGQSVYHFHTHIIPRYKGDDPSPRGGVRNIVPHNHKHTNL